MKKIYFSAAIQWKKQSKVSFESGKRSERMGPGNGTLICFQQEGKINGDHHSWCLENVLIKSWGFNNPNYSVFLQICLGCMDPFERIQNQTDYALGDKSNGAIWATNSFKSLSYRMMLLLWLEGHWFYPKPRDCRLLHCPEPRVNGWMDTCDDSERSQMIPHVLKKYSPFTIY